MNRANVVRLRLKYYKDIQHLDTGQGNKAYLTISVLVFLSLFLTYNAKFRCCILLYCVCVCVCHPRITHDNYSQLFSPGFLSRLKYDMSHCYFPYRSSFMSRC